MGSSDPDLSELDRIDPKQVERLPVFFRRLYTILRGIRDGEED